MYNPKANMSYASELSDLVDCELAKYAPFAKTTETHRCLIKTYIAVWNIPKNLINTYLSELSSMYYPRDELHILARKLRILHIYQER